MSHIALVAGRSNGIPRRARWSSTIVSRLLLGANVSMMIAFPVGASAQAPATAQLDSIRQRLEDAEAALQALREQLSTEASTALRTRSRVSLEFSGRALMNAFRNTSRTNNVDVPVFARPDSGTGPQGGTAMSIRQTRLGLAFSAEDVAGGTFFGDIDVDFFGGQQPSAGGRTFPLVRMRTVRGTLDWARGQLMFGQDQPLVAALDPVSLATIGIPGFAGAGNLWLWLPQVRGTVHTTGRVRVGLQAAVLAPTSGEPNTIFDTQFDAAERTGTLYSEGQLRLDWGEDEAAGQIAVGLHHGRVGDAINRARTSRAVTAMFKLPIGRHGEVQGEAFDGQALRGLGGGGIAQGIGVGGTAIRTRGGWAQLNVQATSRLLIGTGLGFDDPEDADIPTGGRIKNATTEAHLHWRPTGPVVLGLEWRQIATDFTAGSRTNQHLNLALGFEF